MIITSVAVAYACDRGGQNISDWGVVPPTNFQTLEAKYWTFLEKFKVAKPEYNYPTNPNLLPNAMLNIFNN